MLLQVTLMYHDAGTINKDHSSSTSIELAWYGVLLDLIFATGLKQQQSVS